GLLTCCPSPTPRGLGLGPTNPERIILAQGPLGLRRGGFAPPLRATHARIRARLRSTRAPARASRPTRSCPTDGGPTGVARGRPARHCGETQLSRGSIGISPLPTAPPPDLHLRWVRASTGPYPRFTLAMDSSPGFGSTPCDLRPLRTRSRCGCASPLA